MITAAASDHCAEGFSDLHGTLPLVCGIAWRWPSKQLFDLSWLLAEIPLILNHPDHFMRQGAYASPLLKLLWTANIPGGLSFS